MLCICAACAELHCKRTAQHCNAKRPSAATQTHTALHRIAMPWFHLVKPVDQVFAVVAVCPEAREGGHPAAQLPAGVHVARNELQEELRRLHRREQQAEHMADSQKGQSCLANADCYQDEVDKSVADAGAVAACR